MNKNQIRTELTELLRERDHLHEWRTEPLKDEVTISEIGMDSLEVVEISMDIEDHFGIKLPENVDTLEWETFGDMVNAVAVELGIDE